MRLVGLLIASAALASLHQKAAWATAQVGDVLVVGSQECWIQTNPLESLLEEQPDLIPQSNITSTGNWRGYIATWEVSAGQLFVRDIETLQQKKDSRDFDTEYHSVFAVIFPGGAPILADWYSGHLIVPGGQLLEYVHMGYASTYSCYHVFTVVRGIVVSERSMDADRFREFRAAQFLAYKATPEYAQTYKELSKEHSDVESFLFEFETPTYLSVVREE